MINSKLLYLRQNRLEDVITLITLFSTAKSTYHTANGIFNAVHGKPKSAETWQNIALDHPEFFKQNQTNTHYALLIRSFFEAEIKEEKEIREPLEVGETQKIIDQAISLHDKQLARSQRYGFIIPIGGSIITALASIFVALLSLNSNAKIDRKLEVINIQLDSLQIKINSYQQLKNSLPPVEQAQRFNQ